MKMTSYFFKNNCGERKMSTIPGIFYVVFFFIVNDKRAPTKEMPAAIEKA